MFGAVTSTRTFVWPGLLWQTHCVHLVVAEAAAVAAAVALPAAAALAAEAVELAVALAAVAAVVAPADEAEAAALLVMVAMARAMAASRSAIVVPVAAEACTYQKKCLPAGPLAYGAASHPLAAKAPSTRVRRKGLCRARHTEAAAVAETLLTTLACAAACAVEFAPAEATAADAAEPAQHHSYWGRTCVYHNKGSPAHYCPCLL